MSKMVGRQILCAKRQAFAYKTSVHTNQLKRIARLSSFACVKCQTGWASSQTSLGTPSTHQYRPIPEFLRIPANTGISNFLRVGHQHQSRGAAEMTRAHASSTVVRTHMRSLFFLFPRQVTQTDRERERANLSRDSYGEGLRAPRPRTTAASPAGALSPSGLTLAFPRSSFFFSDAKVHSMSIATFRFVLQRSPDMTQISCICVSYVLPDLQTDTSTYTQN